MKDQMKIDLSTIPAEARELTGLGDCTAAAVQKLYRTRQRDLFGNEDKLDIGPLTEALTNGWSDQAAGNLLQRVAEARGEKNAVDLKAVARWARHHLNDPEA